MANEQDVERALAGEKNLRNANLTGANLSGADLRSADLSGADLSGADLRSADLTRAILAGANLTRAILAGANLTEANLRSADLRSAGLRSAGLRGADLTGADLRSAGLTRANLRSADLTDADLTDADLRSADLRDANLTEANLRGADLTGADLTGAEGLTPRLTARGSAYGRASGAVLKLIAEGPQTAREFKRKHPAEFERLKAITGGRDFDEKTIRNIVEKTRGARWVVTRKKYTSAAQRLCPSANEVLLFNVDLDEARLTDVQRDSLRKLAEVSRRSGHPHEKGKLFTVGWVRYCDGGKTWLVEEVQSDVQAARYGLKDEATRKQLAAGGIDPERFEDATNALKPYTERFYEDALGVTFALAKQKGISVEMLTYESKRKMGSPQNIYTELPRSMGMSKRERSEVLTDAPAWYYRPNPRRRTRRNPNKEWAEVLAVSVQSAEAFASILNATRGAPRARVWVPQREGMLPRVYIGAGDGYVEVHRFQLLLGDAERRARGHFSRRALYPSQRAPFDAAVKAYRDDYVRAAMEKFNAQRVAAGEARHKAVYDAIVAGASTTAAIAAATGIGQIDVFWTVKAMHAAGDVLARNLGSDQEKILA